MADPKLVLGAINEALEIKLDDGYRRQAAARCEQLREAKVREREAQVARASADPGNQPIPVATLMAELERALPDDVAIAGEPIKRRRRNVPRAVVRQYR